MERSRRSVPVNAKFAALAQLKALKTGEAKRSDQFQLKEEGDVYEDVDEDTYQEMLKKRREDDFIEDDGASGVANHVRSR
eukprot:Transcript_19770.p2 GENE.Transcript_19770~~Transcript_19770.p2  ORF type:complete len:80 (+),score=29.13 Transcript_19770:51-290(+)